METVTPSIGNTHGVRLSSNPPTKSDRNQTSPPRASAPSRRLCAVALPLVPGVTTPVPAALLTGPPPRTVPGLATGAPLGTGGAAGATAAPAVTCTGIVKATTAGARHT